MEIAGLLRKQPTHNVLYLLNFIVAFHFFLLLYINSSFLATFVGERLVGTVYIIGAVLGIGALWFVSSVLRRFGNFQALIYFIVIEFAAALGLATFTSSLAIVLLFLVQMTMTVLILFSLDMFLESYSSEERTGNIRGTFLTMQNLALILAPLVVGLVLTNGDFWRIYTLSAIFLIPFLYLVIKRFRYFKDPPYDDFHFRGTLIELFDRDNLRNVFAAQFIMRFFFSWMVIYTPIYLHEHIGFEWSQIGVMFTIMLLPYLFIEWPAGRLADTRLGEKELMAAGFLIAAVATVAMSFISTADFVLWTAILFAGRIGAALLEIMTESYFFKHVNGREADTISLFRIAHPLAYTLGPIVATITLFIVDFQHIFVVLGAILLIGIYFSLSLEDTR